MKKFGISRFFAGVAALLSFLVIQACELDQVPGDVSEDGISKVKILLSNNVENSKTIVPSISMTVATYNITGACTGQEDVTITAVPVSQSSVEFEGLASGSWLFTVTGFNASGTAIGSAQGSVSVIQGQDSQLALVVTPLSGNGTLQLTTSWSATSVGTNPVLNATLTPRGGSASAINFSINVSQGTATYSNSSIAAGYYVLSLELTDGDVHCGGATEIVRIAAGQTTVGNISLAVSNHGVITLTITQQMNDPIIVSLANTLSSITRSTSMTVTASASNASGVTFYWYIDGVSVTGTTSCTINGSSLTVGQHRLDVIAFTPDNLRAGSVSFTFSVTNQ